jgi:glutamate-5-semialdehyde dehydrogenase
MLNLKQQFAKVKKASRSLVNLSEKKINKILIDLADLILKEKKEILLANQKDLDRMDKNDLKYDRLKLTEERLFGVANDMRNIAKLASPLEKVLEKKVLENGLEISKISVALGVIGIVYEARPNVTFDVFSLCFKSGNACILKGGSDAEFSNQAIIKVIHKILEKHGVDQNIVYLMPSNREAVFELLNAHDFVDLIIPRGGSGLIQFVRQNSKVPIIETGAGIVHIYFDESGDIEKAKKIIFNAKTRRVSVCNALDTLIIHKKRLCDLKTLVCDLQKKNVELFADEEAFKVLKNFYDKKLLHKAKEEDFGTEFLSYKMSIKTVNNLDEALDHIYKFSSKHSEAIISENKENIEKFLQNVDAACVYVNASTAFTDGAQFGMGAEIGISTQKLHARGPMALKELTSYKWIIKGNGQVRE